MDSCWAGCLGGCSQKLTGEHLVSKSVFPGKTVMVQGFPWCKEEPVEIGLINLTAKILCEKHNNDLSPLDDAAKASAEALRAADELNDTRKKIKPKTWTVKTFKINGRLMERWFLKTLINIACNRELPIGSDSETPGRPSPRLVRIAFEKEEFTGKAGLYLIGSVGMKLTMEDRVQCMTLVSESKRVHGALFGFRGIGFLLSLEPEGPPERLAGISFGGVDLGGCRPLFRDSWMRFKLGKYQSHAVQIKW